MKSLFIKGSADKPQIDFKPGSLSISGLSIPENVLEVFNPILDWVDKYKNRNKESTTVLLNFEYLNTASAHMLVRLIESIAELRFTNSLTIKWYYQFGDYNMRELGEDLLIERDCLYELIELAV